MSNTLHNVIMKAGSKDRPPMLARGNYVQWRSRIKRYIDTKPNHELIHYCLKNPSYELGWKEKFVLDSEGNPTTETEKVLETYKTVTQEIRDQLNAEAEADGESLESYYSRFYKMMNELTRNQLNEIRAEKIARVASPLALVAQQQTVYHPQTHPTHYNQNSLTRTQQAATKNRGQGDNKLMDLISLSFKKIYKPTNNNLQTSTNTSRANQDNSPRIHKNVGYEHQRLGNVAGARETVGSTVVQKSRIQCYNCKE
nr:hypothetical protein [Tanacetum cinerariifolium]